MAVIIPDVQEELLVRVSSIQPSLAHILVPRMARLPHSEIANLLASEAALLRAVDWAIAQELKEQEYERWEAQVRVPYTPDPSFLSGSSGGALPTTPVVQGTVHYPSLCARQEGYAEVVLDHQEPPVEKIIDFDRFKDEGLPMAAVDPLLQGEALQRGFSLQQRMDSAVASILREEAAKRVELGSAVPMPVLVGSIRSVLSPGGEPPRQLQLPAGPPGVQLSRVWGLEEFLTELSLEEYIVPALDWVEDMGAACLEEVLENQEDFAEALRLRPLERARLRRQGARVAARLAHLLPREVLLRQVAPPPRIVG